jgi:hypothetical protein
MSYAKSWMPAPSARGQALNGHDGKNSPTPELLNLVIQKEQVVLNVGSRRREIIEFAAESRSHKEFI